MFGGAQDNGGGAPVDNAQSNRILLILSGVLVLLIFMDFQAHRHYSALADSMGTTSRADAARDRLEAAADSMQAAAGSLGEPIRVQADALLSGAHDMSREAIDRAGSELSERITEADLPGRARDTIGAALESEALSADNLRAVAGEGASAAREALVGASDEQALIRSYNLRPADVEPPAPTIAAPESIYLYFIRFRKSRSELVRVARAPGRFAAGVASGGELEIAAVIQALQAGPTPHESGLINAFDRRVKILSIRLNRDNGLLDLNLSTAIGRLGKHVVRDRLDQLAFTLTQFPEIGGVRVLVDGKAVSSVGSANVALPTILRPSNRIYHNFE